MSESIIVDVFHEGSEVWVLLDSLDGLLQDVNLLIEGLPFLLDFFWLS